MWTTCPSSMKNTWTNAKPCTTPRRSGPLLSESGQTRTQLNCPLCARSGHNDMSGGDAATAGERDVSEAACALRRTGRRSTGSDCTSHALPARPGRHSSNERYWQSQYTASSPIEHTAHHGASEASAYRGLRLPDARAAAATKATKIVPIIFFHAVSNKAVAISTWSFKLAPAMDRRACPLNNSRSNLRARNEPAATSLGS